MKLVRILIEKQLANITEHILIFADISFWVGVRCSSLKQWKDPTIH